MIKYIFFDIGSTLVDETLAYDHRALEMLCGTDISFSDFDKKRREFDTLGLDGNSEAIRYFDLKKTSWHTEYERLFDYVPNVLEYLKSNGYKLGIIANQSAHLSDRLYAFGILNYFDVIVSSAECGASKPDKMIFETALRMAGCAPNECMMVGDRLDNDIIPAKSLGMRTVWISDCKIENELADIKISAVQDLINIF